MRIANWAKDNKVLIVIMTVAACLRLYHADFQSLWVDEVLSMNDANPKISFRAFYESVLFWEAFPHGYFLLLKYFLLVFGYTTMAARILSAIIGIAGIFSMYLLGKELYSKRVGLIAAALTAANIYHLSYSQEIRPYGLFFLVTVLSFYRLCVLIRNPSYKNAIYYGIFTGLIINTHFFGLMAIFAQCLLLLFFLWQRPRADRWSFLRFSIVAGLTTLLMAVPTYRALMQLGNIKSFWVPRPAADSFTLMFKEFFGNSEMVITVASFVVIYYVITLFKQQFEERTYTMLTTNKLIFSFIILLVWLLVSLIIPLIKSYQDVSVILSRYFINVLPVLIIIIAIGVDLIKDKVIRNTVFSCLILFMFLDIFVVKGYYHTPTKMQLRELTDAIKEKNEDHSKIVTYWGWIFPYFFHDQPGQQFEQKSLEEYVQGMKSKSIPQTDFWYADANTRKYNLGPDDHAYLEENFILDQKLEYLDAWAYHYTPKNEVNPALGDVIDLHAFSPADFDEQGSIMLFGNANLKTNFFQAAKGNYNLVIHGNSFPEKPINNENAHIRVRINGKEVGSFFMSENPSGTDNRLPFTLDSDQKVRFQLIYDNDLKSGSQDRNAKIQSIRLERK